MVTVEAAVVTGSEGGCRSWQRIKGQLPVTQTPQYGFRCILGSLMCVITVASPVAMTSNVGTRTWNLTMGVRGLEGV